MEAGTWGQPAGQRDLSSSVCHCDHWCQGTPLGLHGFRENTSCCGAWGKSPSLPSALAGGLCRLRLLPSNWLSKIQNSASVLPPSPQSPSSREVNPSEICRGNDAEAKPIYFSDPKLQAFELTIKTNVCCFCQNCVSNYDPNRCCRGC